jgi:hypothetical protein
MNILFFKAYNNKQVLSVHNISKLSWPKYKSDDLYTVFYLPILILWLCVAARKPPAQAGVEEGWWYSPEPDLPARGFYLQQGHPAHQGKQPRPKGICSTSMLYSMLISLCSLWLPKKYNLVFFVKNFELNY